MKISYPLKDINDNNITRYLGSSNQFGFYPISTFNTWHGGLHLESMLDDILAIADGRVIAYRFSENYKSFVYDQDLNAKNDKNGKYEYSNDFVLIQHTYKIEKNDDNKKEFLMTFYSLYHHLMAETEITKYKCIIPKFLSKNEYVVTSRDGKQGLNARKLTDNGKIDFSDNGIDFVIPKGKKVTLYKTDDNKIKKIGSYKRIIYTDDAGVTHTEAYIHTGSRKVKNTTTTDQLEITTTEDTDTTILGARVLEADNTSAICTKIIPTDETVQIDKTHKGDFFKLLDGSGYIRKNQLTIKAYFDEDNRTKNSIVACDIPVKAGETIGYTGKLGFRKHTYYSASHVEVFTADNVNDLLKNVNGDGNNEKFFTKIKKDTKLKTNLTFNVNLKKGTPISIVKIQGEYVQIKINKISAILENNVDIKYIAKEKKYIVASDKFKEVNKKFNNLLEPTTKFKLSVNVKREHSNKKWDEDAGRIVTFYPNDFGETYWITKNALPKKANESKKNSFLDALAKERLTKIDNTFVAKQIYFLPTFANIIDTTEEPEEASKEDLLHNLLDTKELKVGAKVLLSQNTSKAYVEPPENTSDKEEVTVNKEVMVDLRNFKKVKDNNDKTYYKITCSYYNDYKKETRKGWIKEDDLERFSAYNWEEFGFKALDAGSEYIYSIQDVLDKKENSEFIKGIWEHVDTTDKDTNKKDNILTEKELKDAFKNLEKAEYLSRLVCKHKNEWSYTFDQIKSEIEQIYDFGIKKEKDRKEAEELKETKKNRLEELKEKVENLMFWNEAKSLAVSETENTETPKETEKRSFLLDEDKTTENTKENLTPKRVFPTDEVWHFHPIAFVEHMKMIVVKEDIDLSDKVIWISQFNKEENGKRDGCWRTCYKILINSGLPEKSGYNINVIQTIKEDSINKTYSIIDKENLKQSIDYINSELEKNNPVIVGLHYKFGYKGNTDNTTDHFVVIIGRGYENSAQYFRYYEVGTEHPKKGKNINNRLFVQDDLTIKGGKYIISQVRRNK